MTDAILAMTRPQAYGIKDDRDESDALIPAAIKDSHAGPFRVVVEDAIQEYFEKHPQQ